MKRKTPLEKVSLSDMVRGVILFKQGNQNFLIEDLKKGLKKASEQYTRLSGIGNGTLDTLFYFDSSYLSGEMSLSHYRLSATGKEKYRFQLKDRYGADILKDLKEVSEAVWK